MEKQSICPIYIDFKEYTCFSGYKHMESLLSTLIFYGYINLNQIQNIESALSALIFKGTFREICLENMRV